MRREFRPLARFQRLYDTVPRYLEFNATSIPGWEGWRWELRDVVTRLLGGFPAEKCDLAPEVVDRKEMDGYVREKVIINTDIDVSLPLYILIPKGLQQPIPAVVALHGHGYGKDDIVGIREDGEDRGPHDPPGYQKNFAVKIAERDLIAVAPEQACFGERREDADKAKGKGASSCRQVSFYAMMLGKTVLGMRVWDVMRVIDYLGTRPEVDASRIGCMGISGGGTTTLFASALEERIKAVVVSGYLNTFKDSIMSIEHCMCNYVPGLVKYAEMYDIAGLIAPRPLLVESGTRDTIFPIEATRFALEKVKRVYELLGVPDRLDADIFEGPHEISGRKAFDWLERWLKGATGQK